MVLTSMLFFVNVDHFELFGIADLSAVAAEA